MGKAFTKKFPNRAPFMASRVLVSALGESGHCGCSGLWDTGATNSMIAQTVVEALRLAPVGMIEVEGFHGIEVRPVYEVDIVVGEGIKFDCIKVTGATSLASHEVLIGTDIISQLDFAITNAKRKTVFSFRYPSSETIDFEVQSQY